MSLGSNDGANSLQLYNLTAQYPGSTSESTSNLRTQGPTNYILLPGMGTGYASNATSESGYGNSKYPTPGSNSNVVYLTSLNSQSISRVVARYPSYATSGSPQSSVPQTYPNRLLVINPSANGSPYSTPQSSQGSVPPASVSNSGNVICPGPTDPLRRRIAESNTGVVARWNGQSYNKTTVTSGSSYTKVETYSKWSVEPSFVQYPGGSGTVQPDGMVYTGHPSSNGNGTVAYYSRNGNGFQAN